MHGAAYLPTSRLPYLPAPLPSTPNCPAHQAYDYLEIEGRVKLLNDRFSVMQELLDILRVHAQARCLVLACLVSAARPTGVG